MSPKSEPKKESKENDDYPKWRKTELIYEGDIVEHKGGVYQALEDYADEPPSNNWKVLKAAPKPAPKVPDAIEHVQPAASSGRRRFVPTVSGRVYEEPPEEKAAKQEAYHKKLRGEIDYALENWKGLTGDERRDTFRTYEFLKMPVPKQIQKAYDNWVKAGRPTDFAAKKLKGSLGPLTPYMRQKMGIPPRTRAKKGSGRLTGGMKWIEALKLWNSQQGAAKWCIPRKGSPEHAAIRKMMEEGKSASKKEMAELAPAKAKPDGSNKDILKYYEDMFVPPILDAVEDFKYFEEAPREIREWVYKSLGTLAYADETLGEEFNPIRKIIDRIWEKYPEETEALSKRYKAWKKRHGVKTEKPYKGFGRAEDEE
jgi:hypothetical protein